MVATAPFTFVTKTEFIEYLLRKMAAAGYPDRQVQKMYALLYTGAIALVKRSGIEMGMLGLETAEDMRLFRYHFLGGD